MKVLIALAVAMTATAVQAAPSGEDIFKQRCAVCHAVQPGPGKMGPPMAGLAGRKAGAVPGFAYSTALKNSKLAWTPTTLDTFLAAPGKMVPGTKMLIGMPDAPQRAVLVQYLGTLKK